MGRRGPQPGTIRKPPRVFSPELNCPERRYMLVPRKGAHVAVMRDCRSPLMTEHERRVGRCQACAPLPPEPPTWIQETQGQDW